MRVDPLLPHVEASALTCPHCGQTFEAITDGLPGPLPARHYVRPTTVCAGGGRPNRTVIRTEAVNQANRSILCPIDADEMVSLIYRAQREAAGLGLPRLLAEVA